MKVSQFFQTTLLIVVGLAIPLGALELFVRLHLFDTSPPRNDRPTSYYLAKGAGSARDYPHLEAKPANTFRIVIVGDSFTFGDYVQFDDTFSKRLERWFNLNALDEKVEVINFSKPGFSTFDEVSLVREAATKLSPDLILLQFTLNDPELKPYRDSHRETEKNTFLNSELPQYWKGLGFLLARLKVWSSRQEFKRYYFELFEGAATWNRCTDALQKMKAISDGKNIPFAAVIFPLFDYEMGDAYPFLPLHNKIQSALTNIKVPWIDLSDGFRGMEPGRMQVIPGGNSHPSEIAHRVAAEQIYGWLSQEKLVPTQFFAEKQTKFRNVFNPYRLNNGKTDVVDEPETPAAGGVQE